MTYRCSRLAVLIFTLAIWTASVTGQQPADEQAIRGLATQFEQAWNSHDMNRLGAITRGDLDFDLKPWPPRTGIFSWLVVKTAGGWKLRAVQNTGKD